MLSDELDKRLHVSPPMGMDQALAFRAGGLGRSRRSRPKGFVSP